MTTTSKTITEVVEGIYQVQIPLPFALNIVNCYLLRDDAGWTLVDTGINTTDARMTWFEVFRALSLDTKDIHQIVLTHFHPDHFGLVGWMQEQAEQNGQRPPVYISPVEAEQARLIWWRESEQDFGEFMVRCGVPQHMMGAMSTGMESTYDLTLPHPDKLHLIRPGEAIGMGGRRFKMIHAPGHSDGQLLFYDAADRLLLSGDHVLMGITPNIGLWPDTAAEPLARFLKSLDELRTLDVRLALPGHRRLIHDWRGRVEELIDHHQQRLQHILDAVQEGAETVYDISLKVFESHHFSEHEWRFAIAETLAHLEYLQGTKQVQRTANGVWRYQIA